MWSTVTYYAVLIFEAILGVFGIRLYEEPRYDVVNRVADGVEIRRYVPRLAAEVELPADGKAGRDDAFRLLFAFIAGANQASGSGNARIAMTTPVEVRDRELLAMTAPVQASVASGRMRMQFFLPVKYGEDSAPKPSDPRVRVVSVPGETIATLRFSGSGADFAQRQSELIGKLAGSAWQPAGAPYSLTYDAPFTIPFLRRNEAAVAVVERR
ncbi:MAG: heme-binding protein [Bradyrhizobium sp.]|uniref:SOUL family heme-binding protein n=1 Tax=Bradyrhizobium sp. TaxID=376 RepID=UPI00272FAA42|nr:heme-binding protein [Bradyrhizobium sp.]MDP1868892.1 heme-binding protein [Bradyrhizobium sp.]